ncbi:MAG: hypothetical protein QW815_06550 [Nitrososphaerota archaeon]
MVWMVIHHTRPSLSKGLPNKRVYYRGRKRGESEENEGEKSKEG